jgi:hypothetical protein
MSDMAGNAARAAVERSGSCRDTTHIHGAAKSGWNSHAINNTKSSDAQGIDSAHHLFSIRYFTGRIPRSVS